ncbi:MAG TPA: peptidylprolyl isomerase [Rhodospirillales bacterium]|nr:peptidylprolyl isomerase [Rhodospirillales bacterium]
MASIEQGLRLMIRLYLKVIAIALGVVLFASVPAFADEKTANPEDNPAAAEEAPAAAKDEPTAAEETPAAGVDPVVATVNGAEIRLSQVEEARARLPVRFKGLPEGAIYGLLVNSLIDTHLMAAEARRKNLHEGKNFKRQIKRITNQLLERTLLAVRLEQGLSEDAIKKRYDKYAKETAGRIEVRARHILVDDKDLAKEIIVKLKAGGDFIELAKKHSIGPSASSGGDLGFFTKNQMAPEFSNAAFALAEGEFAQEPIKTRFGWHVIKVEANRPSKAQPFEKAKGKISALLSNEIASGYLKELRFAAKINIILPPAPQQAGGAPAK